MTMDVETTYLDAKMFDNKPVCMRIRSLVTAMLAQLDVKHLIFTTFSAIKVSIKNGLFHKKIRDKILTSHFIVNYAFRCIFLLYSFSQRNASRGYQIIYLYLVEKINI